MEKQFVRIEFDLDCKWEGLPPVYRIYVNDEMFVERTWSWVNCYLTEILQVNAEPGIYRVKVEHVGPDLANFIMANRQVAHGPARWIDGEYVEIKHAST
jgi:hypothetical protein